MIVFKIYDNTQITIELNSDLIIINKILHTSHHACFTWLTSFINFSEFSLRSACFSLAFSVSYLRFFSRSSMFYLSLLLAMLIFLMVATLSFFRKRNRNRNKLCQEAYKLPCLMRTSQVGPLRARSFLLFGS